MTKSGLRLSGSGIRARLVLNGAMARPRVAYTIRADRLAMNDMGLDRLVASGAARVDADRIMIPVAARAARVTGLDTVAGGSLANIRLDGDLAIDWPRILSDNMRLRSDRIDAGLILLADTSKGLYTGAIDGKIDNYRIESVGIFDVETDVDLKSVKTGGFALTGRIRARSTELFNEGVRDFLGGQAIASSDVRYGPDGVIRFANLRVNAPAFRIAGGQGSYSPEGQIAFAANAFSEQYGKLGVRVAGTVSNPRAHVSAVVLVSDSAASAIRGEQLLEHRPDARLHAREGRHVVLRIAVEENVGVGGRERKAPVPAITGDFEDCRGRLLLEPLASVALVRACPGGEFL